MFVGVCWVTGGLCEVRRLLGSGLCEYLMISEAPTPQTRILVSGLVTVTSSTNRKLSQTQETLVIEQHHHQIHACMWGYVGLLVDYVRSGGYLGVGYVNI